MTEIDRERWAHVEALFEQAQALAADARQAFLDTECGSDGTLRDYVLALLEQAAPDRAVEKTIVDAMHGVFGDDAGSDAMRGEMIGPYRVERLVGSGGMGLVYLARRADEQFDQRVAIKLGRHRLVDPQTELRLRNERQILADLDHPNIARLFDGGTTADGVPYLVMEYIDGVRIDTYCDRHRLGLEERLKLFRTICRAVHYAHQNLVIHRDIKASNILVTADGTPKLLDFGIAKLVDPQGAVSDGLTREGGVIMTPANAAPEQITGAPVTTVTDVYTLGLLLFALLSGYRAYDTDDLTPGEFARRICERDPERPSARLARERQSARSARDAGSAETLAGIAAARGLGADRLVRRLRGDLDTIALNALRREPERRYRSANALADDIGLYLRSMPIIARADSWAYRSAKFVRRHYAAVSAAVLVVAMLAAFSIVLTIQNRDIVRERDTAREVSQFLEDVFTAPDPAEARGTTVTAEELLAAGAARIRTDLRDRPEVQAALMATIGRVYFSLGVYDASANMLEQALGLRQVSAGDADVAAVQNDLAETLLRLPDYPRARTLLTRALETNRSRGNEGAANVAKNLFNLAELHLKTSEPDLAEAYALESIAIYEQYPGEHAIELAESKNMLGRILQVRGDLDRTEDLLLEAIEIVTTNEGNDHPLMAYYLQNLGVLQRSKGDLDAAEQTFGAAVAATRRILGERHHLLAATLVNQGTLLHARGDYEGAERVLRDALALHIETRGPEHPMVGYDMTVLGMLLHDRGDTAGAERMLRDAIGIYETIYDADHQYTASALTELGAVLNATGRLDEALGALDRALAIRSRDYPADHELVAATRAEYADTLARIGRVEEAERLLAQSLETLRDRPGRRLNRALAVRSRLDAPEAANE